VGNCQPNGHFHIVWTIDNSSENEPLTVTSSSNSSVVPAGTQVPAKQTANFPQDVDGSQVAAFNLTLSAHWNSDKTDQTQTAKVKLDQLCEQPKTTPPPTVTPTVTPSTPAAPTTLVNTGPSGAFSAFAAATVTGVLAYRYRLTRKSSAAK
jgi:hypothetical protein